MLDAISHTSTKYATLLAEISTADISAAAGSFAPFVPPRGNDLNGMLFRLPLRDDQAMSSQQTSRKRWSSNALPPVPFGPPKKTRRVSEIGIPRPTIHKPVQPSDETDIENSEGEEDETIVEKDVTAGPVSRTPYKDLQVTTLAGVTPNSAPLRPAQNEKSAHQTYEELQAQIVERVRRERAEALAYKIGNDSDSQSPISAASKRGKGKGKMITIPAEALERSLSPAAPPVDKSNDATRKRIEASIAESSSTKTARPKSTVSYDIPFLDGPVIVDDPGTKVSKKSRKPFLGGETFSFGASSAAAVQEDRSSISSGLPGLAKGKKNRKKAAQSEAPNDLAGATMTNVESSAAETVVDDNIARKQNKGKAKQKKAEVEDEEPEEAVEEATPAPTNSKKKSAKKAKTGDSSLRRQAIMQPVSLRCSLLRDILIVECRQLLLSRLMESLRSKETNRPWT